MAQPSRQSILLPAAAVSLTAALSEGCLALWCRYVKLAPADAEAQWQHQFEAAAQKSEKGLNAKTGWRVRELVLIGGLVLPIWGMVEQALVKQHRPTDRRMHVLRLQTTGASLLCWRLCPCAIDKLCCTACCTANCTLRSSRLSDVVLCTVLFCSVLFCSVLFCSVLLARICCVLH